ncbi:FAD-dependent oxidoreductase [uncultured Nocardioides sp.]|uniref:GcvT family protein n=1 Tax=uncultured Nocardioides sp. TaxID=198441 RepID=UPI00263656E0|nr:FAD-dependent oxidoreductase [uncultured Nocardioides sp.]
MTGPRVVVIGAGVVGAAVADELTERGWTDVTVLDAGPIPTPGGSTTHAPGLVFRASGSRMMTDLAAYTVDKLNTLSTDEGPCFLPVGGLEVATTPERLAELHRRAGWLASHGIEARVVDAAECVRLHDLLDPDAVLGGLYTPGDGLAKAIRAVDAQTRRAESRGATLRGGVEVTGLLRGEDGRVTGVETTEGTVDADVVVCCAGIWGQKVAAMAGMRLPLVPLEHQLATTTPLPAQAGQTTEALRPILRHQGEDLYYRDAGETQMIGSYAHRPMPVSVEEFEGWGGAVMPSVRPWTPADFEGPWKASQELLPGLREVEVAHGINGMFSFTTDGGPLVGESRDVPGFWVAEAVWVTHSAGVGRMVAELLVDGVSTIDPAGADLHRFPPHGDGPAYVSARGQQGFVEVYDIIHPHQSMDDPRPLRLPPFSDRQRELDAVCESASGWERPLWYGANASLVTEADEAVRPGEWAARYWSPIAGAEVRATREGVALHDLSSLTRVEVSGRGAVAFLQGLVTAKMDTPVGRVTYCLMLDGRGRVLSDVTVARLAPSYGRDRFLLGVNGPRDVDMLSRLAPDDVTVTDLTPGTCCVGLWGPKARAVIESVSGDDWSNEALGYFRGTEAHVGMVPVTALRVSYVGELGWELSCSADLGRRLWDTLMQAGREHGIVAAGRTAFTSMRLEKGYRAYGSEMTVDHTAEEAGLAWAVRGGRGPAPEVIGEPRQRLVCLTSPEPSSVVLGHEPVLADGECVGYTTIGAWGFSVGKAIAYAWVPPHLAEVGTELAVGSFGEALPYTVTAEPLYDADMTSVRNS